MLKFIKKLFGETQKNCIASKFEYGQVLFFQKSKKDSHIIYWTPNIHLATRFTSIKALWKDPFLKNFSEGRGHNLSVYPSDLDLAAQEIKQEWLEWIPF